MRFNGATNSSFTRVVILGAGFAGLAATRRLARKGIPITLIDRRNHHLFQPLLYQVAAAALAPSDIAEPIRAIVARYRHVEVVLGEAVDVDRERRSVRLEDGRTFPYRYLIVATGARTSWFGQEAEWRHAAPGLKTLADSLEIRRRVFESLESAEWTNDEAERSRRMTFVVVGAGATGVEVAGALREIAVSTLRRDFRHLDPQRIRVLLVEGASDVLGTFAPDLRRAARAHLEELGVEVWTGRKVDFVDLHSVVIDGVALPCAAVIWAAGVRGSPLGARLGAAVDRSGRVSVEKDCSIAQHPEIFVVGDLAAWSHGRDRPLPGVAPVAMAMGRHAADCILADFQPKPRSALRYRDKGSLATMGFRRAVAEIGPVHLRGGIAWLLWVFVHLLTLVSFRNRLIVFWKWAYAWLTADRSSRLLWRDDEGERDFAPPE
jgi:NADH dehydrogenase